jgi:hypothetical protein
MPAIAMLLIGPMLWARFEGQEGTVSLESHATGPVGDDVVLPSPTRPIPTAAPMA